MILIAHRGNLSGPIPERENSPDYIDEAIARKYYVEVDVWGMNGELWLGHDRPTYKVDAQFFYERGTKLFSHCKNTDAISLLASLSWGDIHYFYHKTDDYTFTSNGWVWCFPGKVPPTRNSIIVLPELYMRVQQIMEYAINYRVMGICSDYICHLENV